MQNDKAEFKKQFIDRLISFSISIIKLTDQLPKDPKYWPIKDQIIRSSTSIGANVVEAKSSSSRKDYTNFFSIALKSSNETEYWLMLLEKMEVSCKSHLKENSEIASIIASSILTLKNKR